jgi:natural product biosynthesis luciferase-like monooxygenase protein
MRFSVLFFSGDGESAAPDKYRTLVETTKFADECGFDGVWLPERHFQRFGGLYPNPAVLGAALGLVTRHIQIRAGSVVLPLHHPVRVAEEWATVDNITNGRAAISVATGWHPGDYILAPEQYANRRDVAFRHLEVIQALWEGRDVSFPDVNGKPAPVRILPRPVQPKLPLWLTASSNPDTWLRAGKMGANVLCALISHKLSDLKDRIPMYREARRAHGHDPEAGIVSLMLHTYVGESVEEVRALVRAPMREYLRSFVDQGSRLAEGKKPVVALTPADREALLDFTFKRYFDENSLFGDRQKCRAMLANLEELGVDEAACLVEFGLPLETILQGMRRLNELKAPSAQPRPPVAISRLPPVLPS